MGMAVEFKEISFDTMQQELQIGADDVEAFVIDGKSTSPQINPCFSTLLSVLSVSHRQDKGHSCNAAGVHIQNIYIFNLHIWLTFIHTFYKRFITEVYVIQECRYG